MRARALALTLLCAGVANAQYTVEILHSPLVPATSSYGAGAGGGQQVGHTNLFLVGPSHALLWEGSAKSLVDLHPAGWDASYAMATDGKRQVGWRQDQVAQRATMWSGSAKGWVDLHDPTYNETNALGISGDVQVGFGFITNVGARAVMWRNTAGSLVSLHPQGFDRSWAWATDGEHQVGFAQETNSSHAALWTGSAKTYVDLHPSGYELSESTGVAGGQQSGWASFGGRAHAILWSGFAASFVDLNPGPNEEWGSRAFATNGFSQVGLVAGVHTGGQAHAALWSGTPGSFVDLHTLLSVDYLGAGAHSEATGIDEFGNIVGWARHIPTGADHAVLWRPVPEPRPIFLLGLLSFIALLRRKAAHFREK
ncbi:MAG: hypothetical protein M3R13_00445 [Armatimonadota bacterium]|nr:hypothetical protein [Armatimonadota bacterium]